MYYTCKGAELSVTCSRAENVESGTLGNHSVNSSGSIQSESSTALRFTLRRSLLFPNDLQENINSDVASIEPADVLNGSLSQNVENNSSNNHFSELSSEVSLSDVANQHPSYVTQSVIFKDGSSFYEPPPDYPMEDE